ncbi:MAG: tyrosine-type recombinase/integrase [Acidobacteriaceae bacterium]
MQNAIVKREDSVPANTDNTPFGRAAAYAEGSLERTTRTMYDREFGRYAGWCSKNDFPIADPRTIAAYLAVRYDSGAAVATVDRIRAALSAVFRAQGASANDPIPTEHDMIRRTMRGIRRAAAHAGRYSRPKRHIDLALLDDVIVKLPATPQGRRDAALLAVGFFGALRRSEISRLNTNDCEFTPQYLLLTIRKSKTDQEGHGAILSIAHRHADGLACAPCLLLAWHAERGPGSALFPAIGRTGRIGTRLSPYGVRTILARALLHAGTPNPTDYGAHGLRSGLATALAEAGVDLTSIMRHGRWQSIAVAQRYQRAGSVRARSATDVFATDH